jgi:predicted dehydrogenase
MPKRITRRTFLEQSSRAAVVGGSLLTTAGPARAAGLGANEKVRLGWIGCGGRGGQLLSSFKQLPDADVVAACDVHRGRAERLAKTAGPQVAVYTDFRKLLERQDVDAVIVPTTGHWHCLPTLHACQAGKDVYVEKPLAWSIGEGRMMVKAARKYNRVVMIGTQQRSTPHFQEAVDFIQSGKLGKITTVRMWNMENTSPEGYGNPPDEPPPAELDWDFWLGPAPKAVFNRNRFDRHYWFWDYGGGWQSEWAVHHHDVTQWAMKVDHPLSAAAGGGKFCLQDNTELPDTIDVVYEYPEFVALYSFRHCNAHPYENAWYGNAFYGENGTLVLNRSGWRVIPEPVAMKPRKQRGQLRMEAVKRPATGGEPEHQRQFLKAVKTRERYELADVETGHFSSVPGHLANISYRVGRKVHWDAEKERIKDDPEADKLVTREYRKPWVLEV